VQSQWRLSLQAIKGSSKATEKEANKYVQVGKAFIAIDLGDQTDVISVATDQLSRQEAAAQLEMALNLVYWSELSIERQREVETAIYLYHFSNQEIPPQVALQFLFAAEVLDNDQLSLANASQLGQLNEYLSGPEDLSDYLLPSYANQAVKAQSQANQARQNSLTAQQAKAAATLRLAKIGAMAASGNYVSAIKALATDKEARKQLVEILKKTAAVQGFMMLLQLLPWLILLQFAKEIWAALKAAWDGTVGWAWRQVKSLGNSIKELVTGEPATQASALAADISKEAAAAAEGATIPAKNLTEGLKNLGANTVEAVSSNISLASTVIATSGTAKSIAVVAGAAITVPMLLAATLTIIVITVIGGSLNDLPAGFALKGILQHSYFGQGCWPTSGTISATPEGYPDGSEHLTSDGGTAFDIATINIGKPVYATFDGTARYIISAEGYGLHVKLTTAFGTELIFGHLSSSTITTESNGQRVQAGELIGLSGSTGKSTGPHLHYESTKAAVHIRSLVPSDPYPTFNVYVSHTDCLDIKPSNFSATESGGNNTLDEQTPAVVDGNEDEGNGDNN
jgi:murein DD-endopeptidase MepM/ murein hydrolase activator NlpD